MNCKSAVIVITARKRSVNITHKFDTPKSCNIGGYGTGKASRGPAGKHEDLVDPKFKC